MPSTINRVLDSSDLPLAELSAACLDGHVFAVDECFAAIDEIDLSAVRALALARRIPRGAIAELQSAAWVYGAYPVAPARHRFCLDTARRSRVGQSVRYILRECTFAEDDVRSTMGLSITSPQRTATELLRLLPGLSSVDISAIRSLMTVQGASAAECADRLRASSGLTGITRAIQRLEKLVNVGDDSVESKTLYLRSG